MALYERLRKILEDSELTSEEARAFETGLMMLTDDEQKTFYNLLEQEPELIYPLYINYKAKLRAVHGTKQEWIEAVETEIVQLEDFLARRKVGDEIK
ncbi:MAG: hypothetical protein JWN37_600 [Candidatus Nomurabacteria bacterium]|nr:hypothetical protein [Candidatus Nomurabacteria bacterium]